MRCRGCILGITLLILVFTNALAAPGKTLPFTAEDDHDGARTVWFLLNVSGITGVKHAYIQAKDIPTSNRWLKLKPNEKLQPMDMAWWPNAVAVLKDKEKETYIYKNKTLSLTELKKKFGKPTLRRFNTAEKPLALVLFEGAKNPPAKIPAIMPETSQYAAIFDLAINTRGASCIHNRDQVWVSIADPDEKRVYEIDRSGCITGEQRKVDEEFYSLINDMKQSGAFE